MNKIVRPSKLAVQSRADLESLSKDLKPAIAYRTLEPRMAFDGAAAVTAAAIMDQQPAAPAKPAPAEAAADQPAAVESKHAPVAVPADAVDTTAKAVVQPVAMDTSGLVHAAAAVTAAPAAPAQTIIVFIDSGV